MKAHREVRTEDMFKKHMNSDSVLAGLVDNLAMCEEEEYTSVLEKIKTLLGTKGLNVSTEEVATLVLEHIPETDDSEEGSVFSRGDNNKEEFLSDEDMVGDDDEDENTK